MTRLSCAVTACAAYRTLIEATWPQALVHGRLCDRPAASLYAPLQCGKTEKPLWRACDSV